MQNPDDLLDADAADENRRDIRRSVVITAISLALMLVASAMVVLGGMPA